jgi:hypothetical protein
MRFDPSQVEIFTQEFSGQTKYGVWVGFAIGEQLYLIKKFGLIDTQPGVVHPLPKHLDACRQTYEYIEVPGQLVLPIYAHQLGVPCAFDDDGRPIGDWPQIGEDWISYGEIFMMPGGLLPDGYTHLQPMRWFER